MRKVKELPRIERPREKLIRYGPDRLSNAELLAILLRSGGRGGNVLKIARTLLQKLGGVNLRETTFETLRSFGLGKVGACSVLACFELGQRLLQGKRQSLLLTPREVWQEMRDIRDQKKEHFVVFYLNVTSQIIAREVVSVGLLDATMVHPREVFEAAICHHAAQVIVAHNHPSGSLKPSQEDITVTKRLIKAGEILGIEVLDHVIVTQEGYLSLKEKHF